MKKPFGYQLLSLGAFLLILLALLGLTHRQGSDRLQSFPSLAVGFGLIVSGAFGRSRRRNNLLKALRRID